jgi:hypothetical protein
VTVSIPHGGLKNFRRGVARWEQRVGGWARDFKQPSPSNTDYTMW